MINCKSQVLITRLKSLILTHARQRNYTMNLHNSDWRCKELKIPVPWGHLAVKVWGPENGLPVLALHGQLDNAGTFDTLAPLLVSASGIRLFCLEFSDHGLSSPSSPGVIIDHVAQAYQVKLAIDNFGWEKVIIMAHSMGAMVSFIFNSAFPKMIDKLISLDVIRPPKLLPPGSSYPSTLSSILNQFHQLANKSKQGSSKTMTYHEAREKMIAKYAGSIDEKDADLLLIRGLRKVAAGQDSQQDRFEYSWDPRAAVRTYSLSEDQLKSVAQTVRCPLLIIKPDDGLQIDSREIEDEYCDIYRRTSQDFRIFRMQGRHHVHLSHPDRVAPHIIEFISSKSLLRF